MEEQLDWLHTVLCTDEADFTLPNIVNTNNCRVWTTEMSHVFVELPLQQPKVTVRCGFTADFLIDPFFFRGSHTDGFQNSFCHWAAICITVFLNYKRGRHSKHSPLYKMERHFILLCLCNACYSQY
ncbi:transposable element tc3 transposase [Trichonephila inaurata madagascariensis]|uniref:Transposable element tc3 transposase n=1 Tax=Trichonephila inaurata madagascariensis TaxID=2747483 RepID=A0A8X7C3G7_9ARAC|nr:transposable element tc3 transposase [Trichonephila inaurata madagascariensis]